MKKTNLPFQLFSTLSVNLIPECKLFISPIQATSWSKIKYKKESKLNAEDSGRTTPSSSLNAQSV
jgi:hypothetical protein